MNYAHSIIDLVCDHFGVSQEDVFSTARHHDTVLARHVAMYFLYNETPMSFHKIGKLFDRDHSSVVHARQSIQNRADTQPHIRTSLQHLKPRVEKLAAARDYGQARERAARFGI